MRIELEFPDKRKDELEALKRELGASSYRDLLNNAVALLAWAAHEVSEGREIASLNEQQGTYKVLVLPILERTKNSQAVESAAIVDSLAVSR